MEPDIGDTLLNTENNIKGFISKPIGYNMVIDNTIVIRLMEPNNKNNHRIEINKDFLLLNTRIVLLEKQFSNE